MSLKRTQLSAFVLRNFCIVFCALTFAPSLYAGINVWTSTGPDGGQPLSITVDRRNHATVYLGTWDNGIFKSTNGGSSWQSASVGLIGRGSWDVSGIVVDPFNSSTLYAVTWGGLQKSTDAAATWSPLVSDSLPALVEELVADPSTPGTLYVINGGDGLFKSVDGGMSWVLQSGGQGFDSLVVDPSDPSKLYLSEGWVGIYSSTDAGSTWTKSLAGYFYGLAIDPTYPSRVFAVSTWDGTIFRTQDSGGHWIQVMNKSFGDTGQVAVGPNGTVYYSVPGKILKSTNHGSSWHSVRSGLPDGWIVAVTPDPIDPAKVFVATCCGKGAWKGLFATTDGGSTWAPMNSGLKALNTISVTVDPQHPWVAFGGGNGGLFQTRDGNWAHVQTGFGGGRVLFDPQSSEILYAAASTVIKSTDAGKTWAASDAGLGDSSPKWLAMDPLDSNKLFTGVSGEINVFGTTNGAATWSALTPSGYWSDWQDTWCGAVDPSNDKVLYMGVDYLVDPVPCISEIEKSTDGGHSWTGVYDGSIYWGDCYFNSITIDPHSSNTVYVAGDQGAVRTTDAGATWESLNNGLPIGVRSIAIDPLQSSLLYAATDSGVFASTDAGQSWGSMSEGLQNLWTHDVAISPSDDRFLYTATAGGIYTMQKVDNFLFSDDFESGDISSWRLAGDWSVAAGALTVHATGIASALAPLSFPGCSECTVATEMQTAGSGFASLVGWYQNESNYVELVMKQDKNTWLLRQWHEGVIVARKKFRSPIESSTTYQARISFDGSEFTFFINDSFAGSMPALGAVTGTVGFRAKGATAVFDEIVVY